MSAYPSIRSKTTGITPSGAGYPPRPTIPSASAGDLIILFLSGNGAAFNTHGFMAAPTGSGLTQLYAQQADWRSSQIFYKTASGTESGTWNFTCPDPNYPNPWGGWVALAIKDYNQETALDWNTSIASYTASNYLARSSDTIPTHTVPWWSNTAKGASLWLVGCQHAGPDTTITDGTHRSGSEIVDYVLAYPGSGNVWGTTTADGTHQTEVYSLEENIQSQSYSQKSFTVSTRCMSFSIVIEGTLAQKYEVGFNVDDIFTSCLNEANNFTTVYSLGTENFVSGTRLYSNSLLTTEIASGYYTSASDYYYYTSGSGLGDVVGDCYDLDLGPDTEGAGLILRGVSSITTGEGE